MTSYTKTICMGVIFNLHTKFENVKIWPFFDLTLNLISIFFDKIKLNGILTVIFEFLCRNWAIKTCFTRLNNNFLHMVTFLWTWLRHWSFLSMPLILIAYLNHAFDNILSEFEPSGSIILVSRAQNVKTPNFGPLTWPWTYMWPQS